jgi:signal transduction histidine kinase/purine-cytosine permease-like protein
MLVQTSFSSKVIKARRDYNSWVATETLEDYSLRFAPKSFRKWSEFLVANTALGGISFLALEAIGGSIAISYGFANSFWAILVVGAIIFAAGVPICYYAAKYNIDMDLLTRGAGFGYMGSTITSLIYASFTFIFFALEAAIMAQALELYFHLPLHLGYLFCSLIIIPLVFFGVTLINKIQFWTQPLWLILMIAPYLFVIHKEPDALSNWFHFAGVSQSGAAFDPLLFGAAATVSFSLIAQLGEQVDYLRFLPDKQKHNKTRWWLAVLLAGPGWIILGVAKQLGGAFLASVAIQHGVSLTKAVEPVQMYLVGFSDIFANPEVVLSVCTLFVIVSQIKINVTNAYAGSLAWSNFFSRLTHNHPGRVVWLVFNITIALLLMELGVFQTLQTVLGLYSNVAIAWVGALVADLVINKPLGLSPSYIEFKRAYLYNFNPVGFGSMLIASLVSIIAFIGIFGAYAQAYAPFIALGLAFFLSPIIAWVTKGKYYIARTNLHFRDNASLSTINCSICATDYELQDMAYCPVYGGHICSLCCSLDARCHDRCKQPTHPSQQTHQDLIVSITKKIFNNKISPKIGKRIFSFLITFLSISGLTASIFLLVNFQFQSHNYTNYPGIHEHITSLLIQLFALLTVIIGIGSWWLILTQESRFLAEEELHKQNQQLEQEIKERQLVEDALRQSESQLKIQTQELEYTLQELRHTEAQLIQSEKMSSLGQMVGGIAHEINNPVGFIHANLMHASDYTQDLLELIQLYQQYYPDAVPEIQATIEEMDLEFLQEDLAKLIQSMKAGTERITNIVQSLRTFSRLDEAELKEVNIHDGIDSTLMILQNRLKSISPGIKVIKEYDQLPSVYCYGGQLNQVFMNILNNAIDALSEPNHKGKKIIRIQTEICDQHWVRIRISDNGYGMNEQVCAKVFDPFFTTKPVGKGTGLGLSTSYQIVVENHGGQLQCYSTPEQGTEFVIQIPIRLDQGKDLKG